MISFGEGRKISTVVISTACGYDGQGIFPYTTHRDYGDMIRAANATGTTRISKSMTRHKRSGNFHLWRPWTWKYIQNLGDDGMLNSYGLTNKGVEKHSRGIIKAIKDDITVIPSFFPEFGKGIGLAAEDTLEAVTLFMEQVWPTEKFWAIELNFSCPNTREDILKNTGGALWCVKRVKVSYPSLIIIAKISVVHPPEFARQLREIGTDVLHAVNTIPFDLLFSNKLSPLHKVGGGGVSGGPAFEMAFEYNSKVIEFFRGPVILGCGITDDKKLGRYVDLLERYAPPEGWAISLCTAALRRPEWVEEVIHNFNE